MGPAGYGTHLDIVDWILIGASGVFLALRLYCKVWRHRGLWWDDYTLITAWVALLCEVILTTIRVSMGFGQHLETIPRSTLPAMILLGRISSTFSIGAIALSKTSFSLTLLRITYGMVRNFVWFVIVSMNLTMALNIVTVWLPCEDDACNTASLGYNIFSSAYSAFLDLALTLIPWKLIWALSNMLLKEKIGIALAMSMGVFAAFTAIVKCVKLPSIYYDNDFTYHSAELVIWRTAEAATTIMAASIPVLRVLFRDVTSPDNRYLASHERRMCEHATSARSRPSNNKAAPDPENASYVRSDRSDLNILNHPRQMPQTDEGRSDPHRTGYLEDSTDSFHHGYELNDFKEKDCHAI